MHSNDPQPSSSSLSSTSDERSPDGGVTPPADGVHDFHDAVDEAREIVDFTARQVRDFRELLHSIHSPYLVWLLIFYGATAAVGTFIAFTQSMRDWYMLLAMYGVIFVFSLLYVKAHYRVRPARKFLSFVLVAALMVFFALVLHDRIPARPVWVQGQVVEREELSLLWIPISMMGMTLLALLLHYTLIGRYFRGSEAVDTSSPVN